MLYKGDTLYLDWLEDGIAELVFDAPARLTSLILQPLPASATRWTYSKNKKISKGCCCALKKRPLSSAPISPNSFHYSWCRKNS